MQNVVGPTIVAMTTKFGLGAVDIDMDMDGKFHIHGKPAHLTARNTKNFC